MPSGYQRPRAAERPCSRAGQPSEAYETHEALTIDNYLIDHPSEAVPKATAQLALAGLLQPSKPAEAEKIYKELESKSGSEVAALVRKARGDSVK